MKKGLDLRAKFCKARNKLDLSIPFELPPVILKYFQIKPRRFTMKPGL